MCISKLVCLMSFILFLYFDFFFFGGLELRSKFALRQDVSVGPYLAQWTVISSPWFVGIYRGLYYPFKFNRDYMYKDFH